MLRNFGVTNKVQIETYSAEELKEAITVNFWLGVFGGIVATHVGWLLAAWTFGLI